MIDRLAISVVIPTYQRCASVRRTLDALARQTLDPTEYEAVVSVDGSDDGTRAMLEEVRPPYPLRFVWQPNRGRAAARNAGVRLARGDLVVFLDDDMEPVPGFLVAHREAHAPGSRRAVVGPAPIVVDGSSPPVVHYRGSAMSAHLAQLAQPGYRLGFRDVYTGNLSLRRAVLLDLGGLDESFRLYGNEDYELALRLLKAGVELRFSPEAVAHQHYDKDFPALARDSAARGRTAVLFAQKHPDAASGLKLATYRQGSRRARFARSCMLWLGARWPRFPDWVVRAMTWLERRRPRRLFSYYTFALDYFFWTGARAASGPAAGVRALRIGMGVIAVFALASSGRLLRRALHDLPGVGRPDEITRYEERFGELREALPPRARVGYIGDPASAGTGNEVERNRLAFKRYLLTQYALLPAIVVPDTGAALIVGNFDSPDGAVRAAARALTLVRDFGAGVMLFRLPGR